MTSIVQPVLACTFQAGTSGTAIPAGTGGIPASLGTADGALFDTVSVSGASTLEYSSAFAYSGTQSCQVSTPSTAACYLQWQGTMIQNPATQTWFRLYLYQAANPGSLHQLANLTVSGTRCGDLIINTNGTLSMRDSSGTVQITTTTTVPLNAWYRVEGYVTSSASAGQMEMKLFTSPASTTPAETQTSGASLNTLGGSMNQVRFGPSSAGVTGLTYYMDDVAMSTSGYIGPGPVVFHMVIGAPTDNGFTVISKPVGGTSLRLKVATNPGLTQNVFYLPAIQPDTYGYVQYATTGLSPFTTYYCQLADTPPGGTEALCGPVCNVTTTPVPGTPTSFTMAVASCIDTGNEANPVVAIDDWIAWGANLNVFLGDWDYSNQTSETLPLQIGYVENQSMYWLGAPMTQQAWGFSCRSDHESTTDGGDSDNTWTAWNLLAWQEAFPFVSPLPDPNNPVQGLYQSWVYGRVRFIMTDIRNVNRSPKANTDNSSKTMLGATQLAWLQEQLVMPEPLKVVFTDTAWQGTTPTEDSCGPSWNYYITERTSITSFIAANSSLVKNVLVIHGDAHGVGVNPGWNNNTAGGFPVYCAAPLRQIGNSFTAVASTFQQGYHNYVDGIPGDCRQYGRVTFTDNGQTISVNFQGWDALNQVAQVEQTDVFNVSYGLPPRAGLM